MERRAFIAALSLVSLAAPFSARGDKRAQARIGWLMSASVPSDLEFFRRGLRELGWIEGENTIIDQRYADGQTERLPSLAAELARLKADVFVTAGTLSTVAARDATGSVPVVFVTSDPVGKGWIQSLAHPGGRMTGVSTQNDELNLKMLEVLREAFPRITRVGVFHAYLSSQLRFLRELESAARALSVQLVPLPVAKPADIDRSSSIIVREHVDGLLPVSNPVFNAERQRFIALAAKLRLPAVYEHRDFVQAGGLMSYGANLSDVFARVAYLVDKILKGASPSDLPVEQPTRFELVVNTKTARALGLTIAQSILARADQVIE